MPTTKPDGFLAAPTTGKGAPVLVLHAWWGLNDTMKALCARLADSGFVTFAPDLFHGKIADVVADAEALARAHDGERAKADVTDAATFLLERAGGRADQGGQADQAGRADRAGQADQGGQADKGLAVIGFSFGAYYALDLSIADPERIRSVVVFYGTGPDDFTRSKAAYLGHFAETDEFEPPSEVDKLEAALRRAGRPATIHRYPGVGHWFFEPDRPQAYNAAAANLAWDGTLEFLRRRPTS